MPALTDDLLAHYVASEGVTETGGVVTQWDDQSGNNHHATSVAGREPSLIFTAQNEPMINFSTGDYLVLPTAVQISTNDCALFVCAEFQQFDFTFQVMLRFDGDGNLNFLMTNEASNISTLRFKNIFSGIRHATSRVAWSVSATGSDTVQRGGPESDTGGVATLSNTNNGGFIGAQTAAAVNSFSGRILEIRIYNASKTEAEVDEITRYFENTYGALSQDETICWILEGHSIQKGGSAFPNAWDHQYARRQSTQPKMVNAAIGGRTLDQVQSQFDTRIDPEITYAVSRYDTVFFHLYAATNDISGTTPTIGTITGWLDTVIGKAKNLGATTIIHTVLPRTDFDAAEEVRRAAVNAHIRAGSTGADLLVDIAADSRLMDATDTLYFNDGVHLTTLGYGVLAELNDNVVSNFLSQRNRRTGITVTGGRRRRSRR